MIDGAHVLTPGVLHFGLAGLATYAPAIVATQQWYVGPGQQGDAMNAGYDQEYEDRLFESIRWPSAGHRLFEIGHFVGDRDWLDGVWESNCMFVPRAQLEQVGCFDESFDMPGGGYANLELYERLGSAPDVTVCTILGEGSFHQVHGGTTTNQVDAAERRSRVFGYSQHYAELRGRPFKGPGKPIHFVGRLPNQASRRSKPRRMSTEKFAESARAVRRRIPVRTHAGPRGAGRGVHRGGLAQPPVDHHQLVGTARDVGAHGPARVPADHRRGPSRVDRRDRHGRRSAARSSSPRSASWWATAR